MKKLTTTLLLVGFASVFVSCAQKDDPAPEPVKQPVRQKSAPAPVVIGNPTNPFRTPEDDLKLPTAAQTAEGKESSIGTGGQPVSIPDNAPSIAVTPPSAPSVPVAPTTPKTPAPKPPLKKEAQLDPQ